MLNFLFKKTLISFSKIVKTRFAPSPTGFMHLGALRTALYSFLFAKQNNGKFILRIEDTDQKRSVDGAIDQIKNTLRWTNLEFDEYFVQSERLHLYKKFAFLLLKVLFFNFKKIIKGIHLF
jgi:glutamyl/glutaminyl-tRNA synthetase